MSRSGLYVVVAVLAIAVIGVGAYQQSLRPSLEVKVDGSGVRINGSGG